MAKQPISKATNFYEALEIFEEDEILKICYEKIKNKEQVDHFKQILQKLKDKSSLELHHKKERAKNYPIDKLVSELGHEPHFNRNIKCVIHEDKTASMKLYQPTNSFYCFGCHSGGDPIDLLMKASGMSFIDAVDRLS